MALTPPSPLTSEHDLTQFDCGKPALTDWLRERASKAEGRSARTYVVCDGLQVAAYYCLAAGGVSHGETPAKLKRNMPDPIPIMLLGRLAVDHRYQKKGLGGALFQDAIKRTIAIHAQVGLAALVVHAIDDEAKAFYIQYGMQEFPEGSRTLFIPVATLIKARL